MGSDQARDISRANRQATTALDNGYNQSQGYYDQAAGSYDPYVQTGQAANTFYGNALGLNGDEARAGAQNTITSDPLWSGQFAQDSNNVLKSMNARGLNGSGAAALAGQRQLYANYGNALDRYAGLGAQGLQATGAKAGVLQGQGDNAYGYGATKANQAIQYGNALAANRNTGLNNILGVLGTASRFVNPMNALSGGYTGTTAAQGGR
ncbi:hypothetical protein [Hyphomicrobium sp. ghe19]|uniref:hypothetical protein n=1 Tax=Hyphomicrobium sp. ghe19 TaxID=2682968 RepID=UPI0030CB2D1D